jgi:hypothetical protein
MKTLKSSALSFLLITLFSVSAFAIGKKPTGNQELKNMIKEYIQTSDYEANTSQAEIFTNFIILENGERFAVDFMLTEDGKIDIISKKSEFEYYRVDGKYNARFVQKYSVPVSTINS